MTILPKTETPANRVPLPAWVVYSTFAGGIFLLALMATGGAIAPWAFGFGGVILVALLLPALARALSRTLRFDEERLGWVLVLGVVFLSGVALQLVPLPGAWVSTLSPRAAELRRDLGGWDGQTSVPLSLVPSLTVQTLTIWLVGFFMLCTTILTVRSNHLRLFAWLVAVGTGVWALYGLAIFIGQSRLAEFKPFGVPRLPGRVTGPSVNPNRFAYILEMGLPFCLMFLKGQLERIHVSGRAKFRVKLHTFLTNRGVVLGSSFWLVTTLLVIVALVMTRSRGGLAATMAALVLGSGLLWISNRTGPLRDRLLNWRVGFSSLALVLVLLFCVGLGLDQISTRFSELFTEKAARWQAWKAILPMAGDFPVTGTGAGTFRDVFSAYQPPDLLGQYRFAHNEYLNLATDLGVGGLLVALIFMLMWFRATWRKIQSAQSEPRRWRSCVLVAVLAVALHQVGDFGLQDPAVLWYFCLLLGLGICPSGRNARSHRSHSRDQDDPAGLSEENGEGGPLGAANAERPVDETPLPLPVSPAADSAIAGKLRAVSTLRVRFFQILLAGTALATMTVLVLHLPLACADWLRPGTLWVHIDGVKGGVQGEWDDPTLAAWQTGWESAITITPADPMANYQAAQAEYFALQRELASQPPLAPSVQQPDGAIVLIRHQTPLELTPLQKVRLAQARERIEIALAGSPARPEYHLLRMRLLALQDDLPALLPELSRTRSLYGGFPQVLQEIEANLVYAYQRRAPGLADLEFQAMQKGLLQQLLTRTDALSTTVAFALNRGVTLPDLVAWSPADSRTLFRLAQFLQDTGWQAEAANFYLQVATAPPVEPDDAARSHQAWMCYLETCMHLQRFDELSVRLPEVLVLFKDQDFEQLELFKRHLLKALEDPALQAIQLQNLREIFRSVPPFANPIVEASRLALIGRISFQLEDYAEAREALGAARKLTPDSQVLSLLGIIAEKEDDYTTAAHYYSDMLQLAPANRVQILRRLARSYYLAGQNFNAAETYRLLMTTDPDRRTEYAARVGDLSARSITPPNR